MPGHHFRSVIVTPFSLQPGPPLVRFLGDPERMMFSSIYYLYVSVISFQITFQNCELYLDSEHLYPVYLQYSISLKEMAKHYFSMY